ncbi:MAG TPA: DUF6526 family protein [Pyrinomonadaceae bacterium]|nr:DUF6526 family protein [Pyrinomonadaceae bacterium]
MNPQTFANHTRWHPPFHFFIMPVLLINFIWSVVDMFLTRSWTSGRWAFVALALLMLGLFTRVNALRAQDRVIRLEETLRSQRLLPAALAQKVAAFRRGQLIALRFAPDEEFAGLVDDVLSGKLSKPVEIKKAIKNWRADYFRL